MHSGKPEFLESRHGRRLAYHRRKGTGPGVVFLGGFSSDMEGTKALYLEDWAKRAGREYLRFDYSGHGLSSEEFADGCIGDWFEDALEVVTNLTEGPQVLVGSSMGGWIALLVARAVPERVAGLVGIAAAPDFTEDSVWTGLSREERTSLMERGRVEIPSEYSKEPSIFTKRLIEEGRSRLVLRDRLVLDMPVRLLHGTDDADVEPSVALRLLDHARSSDMRLTLIKGADHRLSTPECLAAITCAVHEVTAASSRRDCCCID